MAKTKSSLTLLGVLITFHALGLVDSLAPILEQSDSRWHVQAVRISAHPLLSGNLTAQCNFPYNPALALVTSNNTTASRLAFVRCQNITTTPYTVTPSSICVSSVSADGMHATKDLRIVFHPQEHYEACGTEDPRISKLGDKYFMFYTAYDCHRAALALAVTVDPYNASAWERQGILFPQLSWSKSGAPFFRETHNVQYLIWGDSSVFKGLHVAVSEDGISWKTLEQHILPVRSGPFFDTALVEAGPPPLPLQSGHLLFLYNSARDGFPSPKPGYNLQYNIGFAILNHSDPVNVLQRSASPILSPRLSWEVGNTTKYLTPNVVFAEGMVKTTAALTNLTCPEYYTEDGRFLTLYGAADSAVGAAEILVCTRSKAESNQKN
eukprot:gene10543-2670_t